MCEKVENELLGKELKTWKNPDFILENLEEM